MAKSSQVPRTDKFNWDSKKNLYDYFQEKGNLAKRVIDQEIEQAMEDFKLRQGQPIDPRELWQKVGSGLARKFGDLSGSLYASPVEPAAHKGASVDLFDAPPESTAKKLDPVKTPEPSHAPVTAPEIAEEEDVFDLNSATSEEVPPVEEDTSVYKPKRKTLDDLEELPDPDEGEKMGFFARILSIFGKKDSDMELDEDLDSVDRKKVDTDEKKKPIEELPALEDLNLQMAETKLDPSKETSRVREDIPSSAAEMPKTKRAPAPSPLDDDEPVFEAKL